MTTTPIDLTEHIQARDGVAVVVYTRNECVQCDMTKKALDKKDIFYTTVNVEEDESALWYVKEYLGYLAAPVVVVVAMTEEGQVDWSGFRPDLIRKHITARAAA